MQGPTLPISQSIHQEKYRGEGETFYEGMSRIADALKDGDEHFARFREVLLDMRFLPGGRVQAAMGAPRQVTAYNCFVMDTVPDSMEGIMRVATEAAYTMRMGGGVGYDFSTLRPRGDLIRSLDSRASGPISFMGIYDAVCKTIASAGHRRGAQMAVLRVDHPDIEEFIRAKQNSTNLTGFNISIAATDEFMQAVLTGSAFDLRWGGRTYKTVDARNLWNEIMRSTWDWAEPGILFIDQINRQNNLWYCETIAATNPCLVEGTLVQTPRGYVPVEAIREQDVISTIFGEGKVKTVERHENVPVFRVVTSDGSEVVATAAHIFHVIQDGSKKFSLDTRLDALKAGDKIRVFPGQLPNNVLDNPTQGKLSDREYGFLIGVAIGDGCYTPKTKNFKVASSVDDTEWNSHLIEFFSKLGASTRLDTYVGMKTVTLSPTIEVGNILDTSPLARGYSHEKCLPLELVNSNAEFLAGYVDGLVSTDGNIHLSSSNPMIRLATSSKQNAQTFKRVMNMFGIHAKIYADNKKRPGNFTQIAGRQVEYKHQGYTICILGNNVKRFHEQISLSNSKKQAKLDQLVREFVLSGEMWTTTIKSITPEGTATVYDLYEPASDTWLTEGLVNRGCGEQPLPPFGACLLGSFNLTRYVREGEFDADALRADIPHVVRAMDNIIDRTIYPLTQQRQEALAKRRMGLGVTGLANAGEALGFPYGSSGFLGFTANVLELIRDETYRASALLAAEKGAFPLFNAEKYLRGEFVKRLPAHVRDLIARHGIRNSHLTSIAPTGTISLCADNVSSGIEPVFAHETRRTILTSDGQRDTVLLDYALREWGLRGKTSDECSVDDHLGVLIEAQRWVDSAVSKTCNVGSNVTFEEFKQLYQRAWAGGCKGATTFRAAGKRFGVLRAEPESSACTYDPATGTRSCEA